MFQRALSWTLPSVQKNPIFVTLAERELKDLHDKQASAADDENLTPMQMALQQGKFDARGHIGQRFTRHLRKDPADAAKYKACETNKEKAAFRLQWLQDVVEGEKSIVKEEKKSYKTVDATKGTYLTLGSIAEKYGLAFDRKAAIAAATRYCTACVRMGVERSIWDDMAEVMLFLYIKTEHSELFTEAWTKFKKTTVDTSKEEMELDGDSLPQLSPAPAGDEPKPGQTVLAKPQRVAPPLPPPTAADDKRGPKIERKLRIGVGQCCRAACGRTRPVYRRICGTSAQLMGPCKLALN